MDVPVKIHGKSAKNDSSTGSGSTANGATEKGGVSRRRFLQILGTASAATATGCASDKSQKVYPRLKTEGDQIPGVGAWYSSTCTECSAGCGIMVKNVDGRAIKVEGNRESPINRGGLCALGQASLQSLYDPDRIREPLKKGGDGKFTPISWEEALAEVSEVIKNRGKKSAFLTGEHNGAFSELLDEMSKAIGADQYVYDVSQPVAAARAAELVFGVYGIPHYRIDRAQAILNFGADFLETWVNPCGYARDWATSRRGENPLRFIHVEPRLSLTGANADLWLSAKPGTEVRVALAVLQQLVGARTVPAEVRDRVNALLTDVSIDAVVRESGVEKENILLAAHYLSEAKHSLVLAGGASSLTTDPLPLHVVTNLINVVLGNVGETIDLSRVRVPKSSVSRVRELITALGNKQIGVLFIHDTNPAFTLPGSYGFRNAVRQADKIVSFASHLDETAAFADIILPAHTGLEAWGDVRPYAGIYGLIQPSMAPVFNTRDVGDILLQLASAAGLTAPNADDFKSYVKASWKRVHSAEGVTEDFETFWRHSLERGGFFSGRVAPAPSTAVQSAAFDQNFKGTPTFDTKGVTGDGFAVLPYNSVKSFDGRAANRPWLQELPDPITQVVWDNWVEIHPDAAKALGIVSGDPVVVRNHYGEVQAPAYVTPHVHKDVIAIPVGQGHQKYGRYAQSVGLGNVIDLLPPATTSEGIALLSARASVQKGRGSHSLVITSGSSSQHDRELARTKILSGVSAAAVSHAPSGSEQGHEAHPSDAPGHHGATQTAAGHDDGHGDAKAHGDGHHGGHHEVKQMYDQREHPVYRWGMAIDLAACTGCSACVVACYAENNIPVVGKKLAEMGREMSWLRIERYYDEDESQELRVSFLPMLCQHCNNAPCEPVCPVFATYHNEEGLNAMIYNRCVGTRYCSNNCSYKVRRFNWVDFEFPEPLSWQLNPSVTKRTMGVMEKCTFCVQRIHEARDRAKDQGRLIQDGDVQPACVQSCPTEALVFGNLNDPESKVSKMHGHKRAYKILDHHLNTQPAIGYLEDVKYKL